MKRISFLTLLSMLLPFAASAYDAEIKGIFYYFSGNEAEVTSYNHNKDSTGGLIILAEDAQKKYSGKIKIPKSVTYNGTKYKVTSIGEHAFSNCSDLESVVIPKSVKKIGSFAFARCSRLKIVVIPKSVTSIGSAALSSCASVKVKRGNKKYDSRNKCNAVIETATNKLIAGCNSTVIPYGVTSIEGMAFCGCNGLTSVTIPESVTEIGLFAFEDCYFATDSMINNSKSDKMGNQLKEMFGEKWDELMKGLTNDDTGDYWGACVCDIETSDGLLIKDGTIIKCRAWAESVVIPNSVTRIERDAFSPCSDLASVTIGNGVTDIGFNAFYFCKQLKDVYCYAATPPNMIHGAFNTFTGTATLHVPAGSVDAYKAAEPWSQFKSIVEIKQSDTNK